jgi:hypothetical protein
MESERMNQAKSSVEGRGTRAIRGTKPLGSGAVDYDAIVARRAPQLPGGSGEKVEMGNGKRKANG